MSIPITTAIGRVQPRYLGEYNSSLNYEKLDNVLYDGCTYVALKNVPAGQVPGSASSSYWQLIANKGNTGGFDTPKASASALAAGETPTVKITPSGPDTAKIFSFEFGIPAGPTGPIGFHTISAAASALPVGADPTVNATRTEDSGNINVDFQFGIPAAEGQGAVSVDNITLDQNRNVNLTAVRAVQNQILTEDQKGYARDNIGAVPVSRTINGKSLASNITLSAANVGAVPTERTINSKSLSSNITLAAADVGAINSALKINGKSINNPTESEANITLGVSDISGAVSTVAGVSPNSSGNVPLTAANVGAIENKAGAVASSHLSSSSVTSAKIASTAVTTAKIADAAVTESKIASSAVTNEKIGDGAVTNSKLASNSVGTQKLIDGAVSAPKISYGALVSIKYLEIINSGWTENSYGTYNKTVTVDGIDPAKHIGFLMLWRSNMIPDVDTKWGFSSSMLEADEEKIGNIFGCKITAVNELTFTAKEIPSGTLYLALAVIHR